MTLIVRPIVPDDLPPACCTSCQRARPVHVVEFGDGWRVFFCQRCLDTYSHGQTVVTAYHSEGESD